MNKVDPKILVISHNPFSDTQNNGKTLSSFFKGWNKDNIRQLYLTLDDCDNSVCNKFYRLSDIDILKGFLNRQKDIGTIIEPKNYKEHQGTKKNYKHNFFYQIIRKMFQKKVPIVWLARCAAWKMSKPLNNKKLLNWVKEFNPDIIVFQTSNFHILYDLVIELKRITKSKLIIETTDDYVTPHKTLSIINKYKYRKMEKTYAKIVKESEYVLVIGDKMKKEYENRFGGKYIVAMNSISADKPKKENEDDSTFVLTYAGNLGLNRWKVLYNLGRTVDKLQAKYQNKKIELKICSLMEPNYRVMKKFNKVKSIKYLGALKTKELTKLKENSNLLVHVESFDKKSINITRLSVSTKIPEYMVSGRCILAIGPPNVASIQYIADNKIGAVLTDKDFDKWEDVIKGLINDKSMRNEYISNALKHSAINHNHEKNRKKIQKLFYSCVNRKQ